MKDRLIELLTDCEISYAQYLSEECDKAIKGDITKQLMKRIEFYADYLIANGVIVPPCKVGDKVWCIVEGFDYLMEGRVRRFTVGENWINIYCGIKGYFEQIYTDKDIGKTVFPTKEEAEQKLVNYKSSKNDVERKED